MDSLSTTFDLDLWGSDFLSGPGHGVAWWVALLPSYLDADQDGKGSVQELFNVRVFQILKIIFDGLDTNNDGLVKLNEARLESFLRPVFLQSFTGELFDFLDNNNDNELSADDIPICQKRGFCVKMDPLKSKTAENCHLLGFPLEHVCTTLMSTFVSPEFDE